MILNIGSTAGLRPRPGLVWYNGTKGRARHHEVHGRGARSRRIRVCALAPVAGETPLLAAFLGETRRRGARRSARPFRSAASRAGGHRQRGAVPGFGGGGFITGVVFEVDGGRCI